MKIQTFSICCSFFFFSVFFKSMNLFFNDGIANEVKSKEINLALLTAVKTLQINTLCNKVFLTKGITKDWFLL